MNMYAWNQNYEHVFLIMNMYVWFEFLIMNMYCYVITDKAYNKLLNL